MSYGFRMRRRLKPLKPPHPPVPLVIDMEWALRDPLFPAFLTYGPGKTKSGPSTISEFMKLTPSQKRFYLDVFKEWRKIVRQKGIDKILLRMVRSRS